MEMKQSLGLTQSQIHTYQSENELLLNQLQIAIDFVRSGFNPDEPHYDAVTLQEVPGRELFTLNQGKYVLSASSLLGDPSIKSIVVDRSRLYLETSPLSKKDVRDLVKQNWPNVTYSFWGFRLGRKTLWSITAPQRSNSLFNKRILWSLDIEKRSTEEISLALSIANHIFQKYAYNIEDDEPRPETGELGNASTSAAGPRKLEMRVQLDLLQKLEIEQRPILCMKPLQRHELKQLMALQQRLLQMSEVELLSYAEQVGHTKALQALLFTLTGQIKAVHPHFTWPEARKAARLLVNNRAARM